MTGSADAKHLVRPSGRGRPREFDLDAALDQAVRVFSEKGYHGTSITDLVQATNLSQGSLYKAFQDKEAIFLAAFDRYRTLRAAALSSAIGSDGCGLEQLRRALTFYAESSLGDQGRQGCLVVASLTELSTFPEAVARHVQSALERHEVWLSDLLSKGQADGSISAQVNLEVAARTLLCLVQGMRVVGKIDREHGQMMDVVDLALKAIS